MSTLKEIIDNYMTSRDALLQNFNASTADLQSQIQSLTDEYDHAMYTLKRETIEDLRTTEDPIVGEELDNLETQTLDLLQQFVYHYENAPTDETYPIGNPEFPEPEEGE